MERTKVLVVDDEVGLTRMLRRNLERTGRFEVREENHAAHAVATAEDFGPEIIFLDLLMPEMDGKQVAAELRKSPKLARVPIVFISALVPTGPFKTDEVLPGPCLSKPLTVDTLLEAVQRYVKAPSTSR